MNKESTSSLLWEKLSYYKKCLRHVAATENQDFVLKLTEIKRALSFHTYKLLTTIIFKSEKVEYITAHAFLILEWNLINRAENCVGAKIDHTSFHQDTLLLDFAKKNTDQEGTKNVDHPRNVYDNPLEPVGCPILTLTQYIISNPIILDGNCNIFEVKSQYEKFNKIFNEAVKSHRNAFIALGISPEYFGTHYIWKGAATFVATRCAV